mmetsp:Transcript_50102/g.101998  ORF Transcript_50102/g.101998 Transcript_50102/m.101998 type:complete len:259 (+) Transcript_50102:277-1053(+)
MSSFARSYQPCASKFSSLKVLGGVLVGMTSGLSALSTSIMPQASPVAASMTVPSGSTLKATSWVCGSTRRPAIMRYGLPSSSTILICPRVCIKVCMCSSVISVTSPVAGFNTPTGACVAGSTMRPASVISISSPLTSTGITPRPGISISSIPAIPPKPPKGILPKGPFPLPLAWRPARPFRTPAAPRPLDAPPRKKSRWPIEAPLAPLRSGKPKAGGSTPVARPLYPAAFGSGAFGAFSRLSGGWPFTSARSFALKSS